MSKYIFNKGALLDSEAFSEASRDELRVLLAAICLNGDLSDVKTVSSLAGVSASRVRSALVLFEDAGVLTEDDGAELKKQTITDEFEEKIDLGKIQATTSLECAKSIRDNGLASLISECATLMGKAALSTEEAKIISSIYTQLALSEDYIITLAAYIAEKKGKLTAVRLGAEAEKLVKRGVDTAEELEKYISDKERESGAVWEFKRICGINNRNLSKKETEIVNRWYYDYGYGEQILSEAFSITTVNTNEFKIQYMDAIVKSWYEAGCKTLDDCKRMNEADKGKKKEEKAPPATARMPKVPNEKPRLGNFDVDDAFKKALLRSYGDPALVERMLEREKRDSKK